MAAKKKIRDVAGPPVGEICFVVMPFGGWLDDYYRDIYCPAIKGAGLVPQRADDLFRPSAIVNDIWDYTKRARIVLADLTGKNPNVFYELGLAHALAKPAILVAESMDDVPFDLRALRVLTYDKNAPSWGTILQEKVKSSIGEVLTSPTASVLPTFLETKGATPKPAVSPHERDLLEMRQQIDLIRKELRGSRRYAPFPGRPISPDEARAIVRDFHRAGLPEDAIIERIAPLGPPAAWIRDQLREIRAERRD